ncbi:RNA-binding protein [Candidatus Woesearchaeota archaeon]|nr:RNA-binding protein [Candidatus Woesearchaeota archaeon]
MTEENLLVKDKDVVVPGEVLATGMNYLPGQGTYRIEGQVMANRLGLIMIDGKVLKSLPLAGRYLPKKYDVIVGKVIDILMSGWRLEINSPYSAVLPLKDASFSYIAKGADLTRYFELDDYAVVKITNVTSQNLVDVTCKGPGLHKLKGGRIIHVNTHKVPRIIGKKGSMVSMIKKATDCKIVVGQNGVAWLSGEPQMEVIAVSAISLIEQQSHVSGLTEKVKEFLEKATGRTIDMTAEAAEIGEEVRSEGDNGSEGHEEQQGYEQRQGNEGQRRYEPRQGQGRYERHGRYERQGRRYNNN